MPHSSRGVLSYKSQSNTPMKKQKVQWFWKKNETKTYKTYDVDLLSEDIEEIISERLEALGKELREDLEYYKDLSPEQQIPPRYMRAVAKELTEEIADCLKYNSID